MILYAIPCLFYLTAALRLLTSIIERTVSKFQHQPEAVCRQNNSDGVEWDKDTDSPNGSYRYRFGDFVVYDLGVDFLKDWLNGLGFIGVKGQGVGSIGGWCGEEKGQVLREFC